MRKEIECCGETLVLVGDTVCEKCETEYNAFGQRLDPEWGQRAYYGEAYDYRNE